MTLPKYRISIDDEYSNGEDLGVQKIAFTKKPAIVVKGMAFNSVEPVKQFFADKLKYRIAAPAMIPMQIYRNQDNEEFYVEFTESEIEKIHSKFMKKLTQNKGLFNLEHDNSEIVPAYILEAWIVDSPESDKSFSTFGIKVPKGTLFVVAQITEKEYYASLVENEQTGFSIEGFLGLSLSEMEAKINEQKEKFNQTQINMEDVTLPEGARFQIEDKWYEVKDGKVVEVIEAEKEVAAAEDVPADEEKKEEEVAMAEEVVEEEVKEEVVAEELAEELPADAPAETYTKAEVDAKFEELYKMLADMQTEEAVEEVTEEMMSSNVALSVADRLDAFVRFSKNNK